MDQKACVKFIYLLAIKCTLKILKMLTVRGIQLKKVQLLQDHSFLSF
jgi:hypothetical protein